jgi:hypothetical protein
MTTQIKSDHADFMSEHFFDQVAVAATMLSETVDNAEYSRRRAIREP